MIKGIIRKIDHLGRVVVPSEIRKSIGIETGDPVEMIPVKDGILLKIKNKTKRLEDCTEQELLEELEIRRQVKEYKSNKYGIK